MPEGRRRENVRGRTGPKCKPCDCTGDEDEDEDEDEDAESRTRTLDEDEDKSPRPRIDRDCDSDLDLDDDLDFDRVPTSGGCHRAATYLGSTRDGSTLKSARGSRWGPQSPVRTLVGRAALRGERRGLTCPKEWGKEEAPVMLSRCW